MKRILALALPYLWGALALADEVKDAPIPTEMNWVGVIGFAVVFFGLSGGFVFAVWWKSRGKKDDTDSSRK